MTSDTEAPGVLCGQCDKPAEQYWPAGQAGGTRAGVSLNLLRPHSRTVGIPTRVPFPWKMKGQIPTSRPDREEPSLPTHFLLSVLPARRPGWEHLLRESAQSKHE